MSLGLEIYDLGSYEVRFFLVYVRREYAAGFACARLPVYIYIYTEAGPRLWLPAFLGRWLWWRFLTRYSVRLEM